MTQQDAPATSPTAAPEALTSGAAAATIAPVRAWQWAALVAILLAAVGLRVHGLTLNSLWIDELFSIEVSSGQGPASLDMPRGRIIDAPPHSTGLDPAAGSARRLWTSLEWDQHPPLYYLMLRLWRECFGSSVGAMRGLSVMVSVAAIAMLFDLGRNLFGPVAALWACLIMALAHQQIWYAQEVRGYAMMMAALVGACAAVVRIERMGFNARRAVALALCVIAAMLTHYYASAGCAAIGLYALIRLRGRMLRRTVATCAIAAAVYAVIWGPFLVGQLHAVGPNSLWTLDDSPGFAGRWVMRLLVAPMRLVSPPSSDSAVASSGLWLLIVLPALLVRRRPALLLPLLVVAACIALPAGLDVARRTLQLDHERYYLAAAPALYLLAAGMLADRGRRVVRHAVPAVLAAYCVLSLPWVYVVHKADWRSFGTYVNGSVRPADLLVFHEPSASWYSSVAYLAMDYYAPAVRPHVMILDRPADPDVLARVRSWPGSVWFFSGDGPDGAARVLPGMAPTRCRYAVFAGHFCKLHNTGGVP
jgi:hypothetical protein